MSRYYVYTLWNGREGFSGPSTLEEATREMRMIHGGQRGDVRGLTELSLRSECDSCRKRPARPGLEWAGSYLLCLCDSCGPPSSQATIQEREGGAT